jgi:hypothetical protein
MLFASRRTSMTWPSRRPFGYGEADAAGELDPGR